MFIGIIPVYPPTNTLMRNEMKNISSVESQKGINVIQRCSIENQKGAIPVQSLWR